MLDGQGKRVLRQAPATVDFRSQHKNFLLAADAGKVRFGSGLTGKSGAEFSPSERHFQIETAWAQDTNDGTKLQGPRLTAPDIAITNWENGFPALNGVPFMLENSEYSRTLAIAPNAGGFLLGTEWYIRSYNRNGNERWKIAPPGIVWALNIAASGQVFTAGLGDGTIRWYRLSDGAELLAFFLHADRKRWVAWTPSGYYDASPGGQDLIGWHLNRGEDREADFFPASRFRERFYRPDVVQRVLSSLDESEAVRLANAEANRRAEPKIEIAQALPPVVSIISPQSGTAISTGQLMVEYSVRTPSGDAVRAVRALVDGRPAATVRDLRIVAANDGAKRTLTVPVPPRAFELALIAENKNGASEAASVRLAWRDATAPDKTTPAPTSPDAPGTPVTRPDETAFVMKPKLYVLAIGVSKYANPEYNLTFAAKDARDFVAACVAQKDGLYREVESRVLADEQATRDAIVDGLDWIQNQTTAKDVAMIFLSGHGINAPPNNDYYFVPHNFDSNRVRATGVVFSEIQQTLQNIAGKALFFVDSCHSGNVMGPGKTRSMTDINAVINELASAENGAVVFSASTGRQVALEHPDWNNGAFTKAVVEGLGGGADYNGTGRITVNMLDLFISERVKALTGGRQTPTTQKPPTVPDFPIAVKR